MRAYVRVSVHACERACTAIKRIRSTVTFRREHRGNIVRRNEDELKRMLKLDFIEKVNECGLYPNQIRLGLGQHFIFIFW